MPLRRSEHGFTLIETTVAVGLLLLACVALGRLTLVTLHGEDGVATQESVEALAEAERVRLLALPYLTADEAHESTATQGAHSPSLLAEVFPSTQAGYAGPNSAGGYQENGAGEARFVSRLTLEDATVERRAWFVRRLADGQWQRLNAAELADWTIAGHDAPPAITIEVLITATRRGHSAQRQLLAGALRQTAAEEADDAN